MFQKDYILRQIELMAKGIAKILNLPSSLDVLDGVITEKGVISEEGYLRFMVMGLLAEGKVNEAENLLFETVEKEPHREHLNVALEFYGELAKMGEEELRSRDFSHEEVLRGLEEIQAICETKFGPAEG